MECYDVHLGVERGRVEVVGVREGEGGEMGE